MSMDAVYTLAARAEIHVEAAQREIMRPALTGRAKTGLVRALERDQELMRSLLACRRR